MTSASQLPLLTTDIETNGHFGGCEKYKQLKKYEKYRKENFTVYEISRDGDFFLSQDLLESACPRPPVPHGPLATLTLTLFK